MRNDLLLTLPFCMQAMDRTEDKDGFSILRSSLVRIFVRMLQEVSDLWCEIWFYRDGQAKIGTGKPTGAGGTSME